MNAENEVCGLSEEIHIFHIIFSFNLIFFIESEINHALVAFHVQTINKCFVGTASIQ